MPSQLKPLPPELLPKCPAYGWRSLQWCAWPETRWRPTILPGGGLARTANQWWETCISLALQLYIPLCQATAVLGSFGWLSLIIRNCQWSSDIIGPRANQNEHQWSTKMVTNEISKSKCCKKIISRKFKQLFNFLVQLIPKLSKKLTSMTKKKQQMVNINACFDVRVARIVFF